MGRGVKMEKELGFWHGGVREKLDFSANLNPYPLPVRIKKIYVSLWEELLPYPDPFAESLRESLARNLGGKKENYLVSNGASELFFLLMWGFQPHRVVIPYPTYVEYERVAKIFRKKSFLLPLSPKFTLLLSSLPPAEGKEIFFLCHPNNPTGNFIIPRPNLPEVKGRIWVIDETYIELTFQEKEMTFLPQALERKDLLVIRSFTKTYSLAGLRLGYLVGHEENISLLYSQVISWSVNHIAQKIGEEVLKEKEYVEDAKKRISREREFLFRELKKTRFYNPYPSVTNFLLVKLPRNTGRKLISYLKERNIHVRWMADIRGLGEDFIRIGFKKRKENQILLTHLKEFIYRVKRNNQ